MLMRRYFRTAKPNPDSMDLAQVVADSKVVTTVVVEVEEAVVEASLEDLAVTLPDRAVAAKSIFQTFVLQVRFC